MTTLQKGNLFPEEVVSDIMNGVRGKSSLVKLSKQRPIPFNGSKEFIFSFDSEIDIVAESGKKSHGGISLEPITVVPIKVEYGARVTDEFMYAAEERKIDLLKNFIEGYSKKLAKGIDLMAMHGVNPRSSTQSDIIGNNHFDSKAVQTVVFNPTNPDLNIEESIGLIQKTDREVSSVIMCREFSNSLASMRTRDDNNVAKFPELAWGASPEALNSMPIDINNTVSHNSKDLAIVGDFANMFQWGYAKEMILDVIEYGDPDGTGRDLKGYNQVYLRAESYVGWAIMDGESFSRVIREDEDKNNLKSFSEKLTDETKVKEVTEPTVTKQVDEVPMIVVEDSNDEDSIEITTEQIKQELNAFGIEYDENADKETLYNLMMNHSN